MTLKVPKAKTRFSAQLENALEFGRLGKKCTFLAKPHWIIITLGGEEAL